MKHCVFSKWSAAILPATLLLLAACSKHEEIDFSGTIIDTRECTLSYLKPDLGYIVELSTPTNYGADYTLLDGTAYHNAVILYDPDQLLYLGDHLRGTFYLDDEYSRANCSVHWNDIDDLPMGVFTAVSVD